MVLDQYDLITDKFMEIVKRGETGKSTAVKADDNESSDGFEIIVKDE